MPLVTSTVINAAHDAKKPWIMELWGHVGKAYNVTMEVDGVLYLQVMNSRLSAYGIDDYHFAAAQLAQTSLRSAIGKISLDNTFA